MHLQETRNLFDDQCEIVVGNTIITSLLYLQQNHSNAVVLVLTPKYIFYHLKDNKQKRMGFLVCFQVVFEVLRKKLQGDSNSEIPYGLAFRSEGCHQKIFYSDNIKDLQKWELQLRKFLNQFNFHNLFKAEKRLGRGNFATVYLASQKKDGKKIAIKAFGREAAYCQENGKEALINEVKITRMFNHPNLMKFQGVYESENSLYLALEYIDGTPVSSRINHLDKYAQPQRRLIMKGILQGLSEMARKNIIHRDLKPQNILVGKETVIIDFGLATIADDPKYLFVRCGTPGYVAPEIINIKDLSTKSQPVSDVFSAGCIFYYIVFNKHLFTSRTGQDIIALNRQCDLVLSGPDFDKIKPKCNIFLNFRSRLNEKMLQKQPELRISAAQALKHAYFADVQDKIYIPKILMKQSGSCPIELIEGENEAAVKFILKGNQRQSQVKANDKANNKSKVEKIDMNKWLINL